jgi:hypothetical protein
LDFSFFSLASEGDGLLSTLGRSGFGFCSEPASGDTMGAGVGVAAAGRRASSGAFFGKNGLVEDLLPLSGALPAALEDEALGSGPDLSSGGSGSGKDRLDFGGGAGVGVGVA